MNTNALHLHHVQSWRDPVGRIGLATKGVLYAVIGLLAVQFARGDTASSNVDREGAIETVARQPFGKFLLVAIVIGLVALTVWHVVLVATGDPVRGGEAKDRAQYGFKAAVYGAAGVTAASVLAANWSAEGTAAGNGQQGSGSASGGQPEQQATAMLLDLPGGRLLTGAAGVGLVAFAVYEVWHHTVQARFMERISTDGRSERAIEGFGRVGHAARAVVAAMTGIFVIVAAVQYDASESKGMSGALTELAERTGGAVLLWLVAVGLFAYGLFTLAESRYRPAA